MKHTLQLDTVREIKFTMPAMVELDSTCGINLLNPATYSGFSPKKLCDIIWVGQMHTKKPLARNVIAKYLPTETTAYYAVVKIVSDAIYDAIADETDKAERADKA